jgi:hypothetical protein
MLEKLRRVSGTVWKLAISLGRASVSRGNFVVAFRVENFFVLRYAPSALTARPMRPRRRGSGSRERGAPGPFFSIPV